MRKISLKQILTENIYFFLPFVLFIVGGAVILINYSKTDIHLYLNGFYSDFFDRLFTKLTWLGDGIFVVMLSILLVAFSFRKSIFFISTYLFTGIIVQILKRVFFSEIVRPAKYFEGIASLRLVEGVNIHYANSFPSGHTATAFGLFLCLALITKNKVLQFLFSILAIFVGYSRIYLSQHFFSDIYAGSIIGVAGGLLMYYVVYLSGKKWLNHSLFTVFKKNA